MSAVPISVSLPAHFQAAADSFDMASVRADRFEKTLKAYAVSKGNHWGNSSEECWLADMLADALHWCDVNGNDAKYVLSLARSHYESEKLEDVTRKTATAAPAVQRSATPPH